MSSWESEENTGLVLSFRKMKREGKSGIQLDLILCAVMFTIFTDCLCTSMQDGCESGNAVGTVCPQ